MAYSTSNPPALVHQMVGKNGGSTWVYDSADAATLVRVSGYFTDGYELGLKVGDVIHQRDTTGATVAHDYVVLSVVAATGVVDVSDGTATPSLTDTD